MHLIIDIGPSRSGTTWLYEVFKKNHTFFNQSKVKEIQYYNLYYDKGICWYFNHFKDNEKYNYDISNLYYLNDQIADLLFDLSKNIKLKVIIHLRNPEDLIISYLKFASKRGIKINASNFEKITIGEIIGNGNKSQHNDFNGLNKTLIESVLISSTIEKFKKKFDKKDIFLFNYELLKEDPNKLCQKLSIFLKLEQELKTENKTINESKYLRYPILGSFINYISTILRNFQMYETILILKNNKILNNLLYSNKNICDDFLFLNKYINIFKQEKEKIKDLAEK